MAKGAAAAGESARFAQWHDATLAAGPVCRARRQRRWRGVDDAGGIGAERAEQGEADVRKMEPALYDTCLLSISHHGAEHHPTRLNGRDRPLHALDPHLVLCAL